MRKIFTIIIMCFFSTYFASSQLILDDIKIAAEYSKNANGAAVLVYQNGKTIFEEYHNGADSSTATHIHSATKAFWSVMAAHMLQTNIIDSYEELVSNTITEWKIDQQSPGKRLITIEHLLSLSSGLSHNIEEIQGSNPSARDIYQYVVDSLNLVSLPGKKFSYGPSHYYTFGILLQRKLKDMGISDNPLEYLEKIIFEPIGLKYTDWLHDSVGNPHIPNGCFITPREWLKFGKLLLNNGVVNGSMIVDSNLVKELFTYHGPNPGHGRFVWLNTKDGYGISKVMSAPEGSNGGWIYHNGFTDIIGALGAGKNRMYIIPSLEAIIIRQTLQEEDNFDDNIFLSMMLDRLTSVEVKEFHRDNLQIYPNPASEYIEINPPQSPFDKGGSEFASRGISEIRIYNTLGEQVMSTSVNFVDTSASGGQKRIDISHLPIGIYFIQIGNYSQKFMVVR